MRKPRDQTVVRLSNGAGMGTTKFLVNRGFLERLGLRVRSLKAIKSRFQVQHGTRPLFPPRASSCRSLSRLPLLAISDLTLHFSQFPPSLTASPGLSSSFAAPSLLCPSVAFLLHLSLQEASRASSPLPRSSSHRLLLVPRVSSAPILSHNKLMI
ncbi:hypothetical protein MUK42_19223 [Musa troglodytarum]|uniref:Uncharacterized protein n=1 Tax=Musa troglodytarum TaxID=320322 RepID=A0A9E7H3L6_9LILI|nr:hypothetical protein MUK42_19223 [Musa troglodytarum]URE23056.1 hypothetical protein MUK42_19223 [Musa troglodytarum]